MNPRTDLASARTVFLNAKRLDRMQALWNDVRCRAARFGVEMPQRDRIAIGVANARPLEMAPIPRRLLDRETLVRLARFFNDMGAAQATEALVLNAGAHK